MTKLRPEDLEKIAERMKKSMSLRDGDNRAKITVHMGTCGIAAGARTIMSSVMSCIDEAATGEVVVTASGCAGLCSREPMMTVEIVGEAPVKYVDLDEAKVQQIFSEHVVGGKIAVEHALAVGSERTP